MQEGFWSGTVFVDVSSDLLGALRDGEPLAEVAKGSDDSETSTVHEFTPTFTRTALYQRMWVAGF